MSEHENDGNGCGGCGRAIDRRAFMRAAALSAGATLAAIGLAPSLSFAEAVRAIAPTGVNGAERSYSLPPRDGAFVDADNEVIIARWKGRAYAFALACPHKGARLQWRAEEERVYCPKHKARFHADGTHASGRRSRQLDRYDVRVAGGTLLVDFAKLHRSDQDPSGWAAAQATIA